MPIEIKELHIKISVNESSKPAKGGDSKGEDSGAQEYMEQVAKMIKNKKER